MKPPDDVRRTGSLWEALHPRGECAWPIYAVPAGGRGGYCRKAVGHEGDHEGDHDPDGTIDLEPTTDLERSTRARAGGGTLPAVRLPSSSRAEDPSSAADQRSRRERPEAPR